jgi:hypothetical protein
MKKSYFKTEELLTMIKRRTMTTDMSFEELFFFFHITYISIPNENNHQPLKENVQLFLVFHPLSTNSMLPCRFDL